MNYAIVENGLVLNVAVWDEEPTFEPEKGVWVLVKDDEIAGPGWTYDGQEFIAPPEPEKTKEEIVLHAEQERLSLISSAEASIRMLQTKLLLGRKLTDAELEQINGVIDYIDALYALDTSTAPDVIWPELPEA
ncbi:tail fiber assembly protein [Escherichia coli]